MIEVEKRNTQKERIENYGWYNSICKDCTYSAIMSDGSIRGFVCTHKCRRSYNSFKNENGYCIIYEIDKHSWEVSINLNTMGCRYYKKYIEQTYSNQLGLYQLF